MWKGNAIIVVSDIAAYLCERSVFPPLLFQLGTGNTNDRAWSPKEWKAEREQEPPQLTLVKTFIDLTPGVTGSR